MPLRTLVVLYGLAAIACGGSKSGGGGGDVTGTVGPSGGTVSLPSGASVQVPAGALSATTTLTITESATAAPAGALTPVFQFGPAGTTFTAPVTVSFPVPAGTTAASIYWTSAGSTTEYDAIPTTLSGTTATGQVTHFSGGFVGAACASGAACTPANACHHGATTCNGTPACADTGAAVQDGAACGSGGTCTGGACVVPGGGLVGTWAVTGGVPLQTVTLIFNANGTFSLDFSSTAGIDVVGTFQVAGSRLTLIDTGGPQACQPTDTGAYTFAITGSTVTFTLSSDACSGRSMTLTAPGPWTRQ